MTKGEGLIGLLYALKDLINDFAIMFITGIAVVTFFYLIVGYIAGKAEIGGGGNSWLPGKKIGPKQIMWGLFILFVIFAIYSLIGLTAAIFGVNSSPSGGLLVQ